MVALENVPNQRRSAVSARADRGAPGHPWVLNRQHIVRFGIGGGPFAGNWSALREFVQMVEELGFDSYWRPDHPVFGPDAWMTLAAVAASTNRLRLGTTVSCVFHRHPLMLARIVADLDRISGGRAVLGLGAGNLEPEFRALGIAYPRLRERQAALVEALQILPPLLRGETVSFHGVHFQVDGVKLQPGTVQQPYVPVLVAGVGERITLRAVAEYADASNFIPSMVALVPAIERKYAMLREHCVAISRPYDSVLRTYQFVPLLLADTAAALAAKRDVVPPFLRAMDPQTKGGFIGTPEQAVERLLTLVGAGCQYFILSVLDLETLRLVAERVVPAVLAEVGSAVQRVQPGGPR
ncbi:MAG: LLM class flavin-dependent oxidoreductase [Alphaproteobacteria bacterium]|nr:LLM class flavin-dependent oxidoreductase [Alphaproteobacteria bacterium]